MCALAFSGCGFITNAELKDRLDADNDGYARSVDCDDSDPDVTTFWFYLDIDQDQFGDGAQDMVEACAVRPGLAVVGQDCDDRRPDVNPNASEICNFRDDNCDGMADNDVEEPFTFFQDADRDGFGNADVTVQTCVAPDGYVADNTDCDDTNAETRGQRMWYVDNDGDGWGDPQQTVLACTAPEGTVGRGGDCDDTQAHVHPDAPEVCSDTSTDEDCDGLFDDEDDNLDASAGETFYFDDDGDGHGDPFTSKMRCKASDEWVDNRDDCNDASASADNACDVFLDISAGATATCVVRGDAQVECWGSARISDESEIPEGIFEKVAVGYEHACALSHDGELSCWGDLGPDSYQSATTLVEVQAGRAYTCSLAQVLTSESGVYTGDSELGIDNDMLCWAYGGEYRMGVAGQSFDRLAVGASHACGLLDNNEIRCIGVCDSGECRTSPGPWTAIATGLNFTCGLHDVDGTDCWGNYEGDVPDGDFDAIKAFGPNVCASSNDGRLTCWSNASTGYVLTPPDVRFDSGKWDVGTTHACGIDADTGEIHCWGGNAAGQASPPF